MANDRNGIEVGQRRWEQVDLVIRGFIRRNPLVWTIFRKELEAQRTDFQLAKEGDLRKSGFRNTLSFPVAARRLTPQERADSPEGSEVEFGESLKDLIDKVIPGFTDPDQDASKADGARTTVKNALYREFVRRYASYFQPGDRF